MAERPPAAKDATQLSEAVELMLSEQRKFVRWWDGQEKQHGGVSDRKRHLPQLGTGGLPDRLIVHRWRTRLKDAKKFETLRREREETT